MATTTVYKDYNSAEKPPTKAQFNSVMHKTPTMSSSIGGWANKKSFNKFVDTTIISHKHSNEPKNTTFGQQRTFDAETTKMIA